MRSTPALPQRAQSLARRKCNRGTTQRGEQTSKCSRTKAEACHCDDCHLDVRLPSPHSPSVPSPVESLEALGYREHEEIVGRVGHSVVTSMRREEGDAAFSSGRVNTFETLREDSACQLGKAFPMGLWGARPGRGGADTGMTAAAPAGQTLASAIVQGEPRPGPAERGRCEPAGAGGSVAAGLGGHRADPGWPPTGHCDRCLAPGWGVCSDPPLRPALGRLPRPWGGCYFDPRG